MGPITNYNFNTKDGIVYDCNIKITDRQALFTGFRIDTNSIEKTNKGDFIQQDKLNFKDFIRLYLPFLDECITRKENFKKFIKNLKFSNEEKEGFVKSSGDVKDMAKYWKYDNNGNENSNTNFFNGVGETRVFFGRNKTILSKSPISPKKNEKNYSNFYSYGTTDTSLLSRENNSINPTTNKVELYSNLDKNYDFDRGDKSDEIWFQLDFLFELLNEHIPDEFNIDYDVKVNAHPNLISCDKNVLIPNPIAPKINRGTVSELGGYLDSLSDESNNKFFEQPFVDIHTLDEEDDLYFSFNKSKNVFKTGRSNRDPDKYNSATELGSTNSFRNLISLIGESIGFDGPNSTQKLSYYTVISERSFERQNLNKIINYYPYLEGINNENKSKYSFPQEKDIIDNNIAYKSYRYGYLKHLYISRSKVIDLTSDDSIKTIQQFIESILKVINESVNNYWSFDVINSSKGGLTIIDKSLNNMDEIYTFELSSDNNVLKEINFDVNMSPENATQILFFGGNNKIDKSSLEKQYDILKSLETKGNDIDLSITSKSLPNISFIDRFDIESESIDKKIESLSGSISNLETFIEDDKNVEIQSLQTYGVKRDDTLLMTLSVHKEGMENRNVYYMLNFPSTMKQKLTEILNDEDYENNVVMYSNVAENFLVELRLDGIFGFRMFQHFAINNLPKPYVQGNCIFMIKEISHSLVNGNWETNITAMLKGVHSKNITYYLI